jgi:patatin-like phospholipase/acyl hydrolase
MEDVAAPPAGSDFRVLSLDGGGSKGVYTLGVLAEVEALFGSALCHHFQLIYGTSTGAIIAALLGLGHRVEDVRKHYFELIPKVMSCRSRVARTAALEQCVHAILPEARFEDMKTNVGIVVTNYETEQVMIFKSSARQAHGLTSTFVPGFGVKVADAVLASAAAFPFFKRRKVTTANQGAPEVIDGGFVANNPTLFALADALNAFGIPRPRIKALSVGVGIYSEPKRSSFRRYLFSRDLVVLALKVMNSNTNTLETLRTVMFKDIDCIRVNDAFPEQQYATDLLESDPEKLLKLHTLGRRSFARQERVIRTMLQV